MIKQQLGNRIQQIIEIKACKLFRSEDVNYCITCAIMFTADRKAVFDKFVVWATSVIKEKIKESFKVSFCSCVPMLASGCLSNLTQIYA